MLMGNDKYVKTQCSTLVLDFGGVITRTLFETHALTERELGLPQGTLKWLGPFSPESDELWQKMQRDEITERDYWLYRAEETGKLIGENWRSMKVLVQRARGNTPDEIIRPEFLTTYKRVKAAGKKISILSNELDLFYGAEFRYRLPFISCFDLVVDATYTKILKPDSRAYAAITSGLGVTADSCVFVDDQLRNVAGAAKAGMQTVHFDVRNPDKSYQQAMILMGIHN